MRPPVSLRSIGFALAVSAGWSSLPAQRSAPRPAGPKTIVGVVLDTLGNPVDSVEVLVASVQRGIRSGSDGTFRFDDVKPGRYDVAARRPGYFPQVRSVIVDEKGGTISFSLVPSVRALPPVVSSAPLGGLGGVIGDTAYSIVEGARISVVASDHRTQSDSMGRFFIGLKPGKYVVRVERTGFRSRLVSLTIPNDSGRRMTVWLTPSTRAQEAREAMALDSLEMRLAIRNPVWSNIYTREDIDRLGIEEGAQLARLGANSWKSSLDDRCLAVIDGGPNTAPLWSIDAANLEMMEVYSPRRTSRAVTNIKASAITATAPALFDDYCNEVRVFVWLRK